MSKEGKVLGEIGRENPFRVPEGYFEHFASELMTRLPEKEKVVVNQPTTWEKVRPWVYMAAMFVGAALIIRVASARYDAAVEVLTDKEDEQEMEYINAMMESSMLDDYALYVYLAGDETE